MAVRSLPASLGHSWKQAQTRWNILRSALKVLPELKTGPGASKPTASTQEGNFYYAIDEEKLYLSVEGAWKPI